MVSEADILTALRDCYDPEVKLNLVDLGLIYAIGLETDPDSTLRGPRQRVRVTMTLTSPACPDRDRIVEQVRNRLAAMPGIGQAEVELAWQPEWTPHRVSPAGRRQLGI